MQHHFHIKFKISYHWFFRRSDTEWINRVKVKRMAKLPGRGSGGERRGKGGRRAWEAQWEAEGYRRFLSRRLNRSSCSKRRRRRRHRRFGASWRRKPWSEMRPWSLCVWVFVFCPWLSERVKGVGFVKRRVYGVGERKRRGKVREVLWRGLNTWTWRVLNLLYRLIKVFFS